MCDLNYIRRDFNEVFYRYGRDILARKLYDEILKLDTNCRTYCSPKSNWSHSWHLVCSRLLSRTLFLGRCSGSYYGIITPFPRALENNWRVIGQRRAGGARESNGHR